MQHFIMKDPRWLAFLPITLSTLFLAVMMESEFMELKDYKYKMPTTVLINL
jgi:hypothetical protein